MRYLLLWVACFGLYLAFSGSVSFAEVIAGGIVAATAVLLSMRLRRAFRRPLQCKARWLLPLCRIVPALFAETWQLYGALWRRLTGKPAGGRFIGYPYAYHDDPSAGCRFTVMIFGVSITPNSYPVAYDPKRRMMLLRQLVGEKVSRSDRLFLELP